MGPLLRLLRGIDQVTERVGKLTYWLTLFMVLLAAFNAVARYQARFTGLNLSSNAFIEGQWYLFSMIFLLGGGYALKHGVHVRVDVIYGNLGFRGKARINLVGNLIFLIPFCLFMLYFTWPSVVSSWHVWEQSPDPGGLPRFPIKTMVPAAFILLLMQGVADTIRQVALLRGLLEPEPEEVPLGEVV